MPSPTPTPLTLDALRSGGKAALARALASIEIRPDAPETIALLSAAYAEPRAHVVGITGPPGVGKSTLINALLGNWRKRGRSVGVIAVDPSSRRSGGALLGDRTRLSTDPEDQGIFVRSMAARDRLGGLAGLTVASMVLMRALFDVVLIETVGVGQSETDVVRVADTVLFCVQPGSGDSLQFMKAGIAEIPHIVLVTKADMEREARRARADVEGALSLGSIEGRWDLPVLMVSSQRAEGIEEAVNTIDRHAAFLAPTLNSARQQQGEDWLEEFVRERFGREGLKRAHTLPGGLKLADGASPFLRLADISGHLTGLMA
jgi:LAO/AO transport system kinase